MQRFRVIALVLAAILTCASAQARGDDFPRLTGTVRPSDFSVGAATAEALLVLHYHRANGDYAGWNIWAWPDGGEGSAFELSGKDAFGRYAVIPFAPAPTRAGFIVRRGNWEEKDFDQDRFVALKNGAVNEIWVTSGEEAFTDDPRKIDLSLRVDGAFLDDARTIVLALSRPLGPREQAGVAVVNRRDATRDHRIRDISPDKVARLSLARALAPDEVANLEIHFDPTLLPGLKPVTVFARGILEGDAFTPAAGTRFGAICTRDATQFATWSPVSDAVELLLYDDPAKPEPTRTVPLTRGAKGLWSIEVRGDLHGIAYRYRFHNYGEVREVPDMWAFAANSDSTRTVVVDLSRLEPDGFRDTPAPRLAQPTDEVLYEIHVRDYSAHHPGVRPDQRGTYLGLCSTSHLEELGVTAVHLMPIQDFTARVGDYNWGYWTTLFNVPESNYSTDPADPTRAITDLRTAITALHRAGLRVVLDCAYNHTSDAGLNSPFGAPAPYYFFRTTAAGRLTNDSGTGNGFADERPMARRYILDSLAFWLEHYKVDGFRFDLLGTHQPETVRAICDLVKSMRPDATLSGEPWTGGGPTHFGKGAQKGLPIAVFNDHLRNAIRGDLDGDAVGFATGPGGDTAAIRRGVAGAIDDFTQEPGETINYAGAHDNLVLWDKIAKTQPSASDATRRAMQRLALGIVLTSQGIPFLHGGDEFARTKQGNHNSYNAGDDINDFGWTRSAAYGDISAYTAGLIAVRRAHLAFRLDDDAEVRRALRFLDTPRIVAFTLDGSSVGDPWPRILVAYNDEPEPRVLRLPEGDWSVVANGQAAGLETLEIARKTVVLTPYSVFIAHATH